MTRGILVFPPEDPESRQVIDKLAQYVASGGDSFEKMMKMANKENPAYKWVTL